MSLFERPLLGDEYSPKKNAPLIFMPVTIIAVVLGICGIIANFMVLVDGPDGKLLEYIVCARCPKAQVLRSHPTLLLLQGPRRRPSLSSAFSASLAFFSV